MFIFVYRGVVDNTLYNKPMFTFFTGQYYYTACDFLCENFYSF